MSLMLSVWMKIRSAVNSKDREITPRACFEALMKDFLYSKMRLYATANSVYCAI